MQWRRWMQEHAHTRNFYRVRYKHPLPVLAGFTRNTGYWCRYGALLTLWNSAITLWRWHEEFTKLWCNRSCQLAVVLVWLPSVWYTILHSHYGNPWTTETEHLIPKVVPGSVAPWDAATQPDDKWQYETKLLCHKRTFGRNLQNSAGQYGQSVVVK